ncbi:MAG: MFS transporter [Flavobacteriales bacterium]|nr:MFS transporter [Flavobacteriales bacterium]
MVARALRSYQNSFRGLSVQVWWLAFITLINRAGTMVIPFLSLYLTEDLGFTLSHVGWIMTAFGVGSVCGAWLGGKLTNKFGFYQVMYLSLIVSGFLFVGLQYIKTFEGICVAIFILMVVADTFRPALFVAVAAYCKPQNRTRSVTLIRLAINLGFSFGPAIGGAIILATGYSGLFWVDGVTCGAAGLLFLRVLRPKKAGNAVADEAPGEKGSPYKDKVYGVFLLAMFLIGFAFLQYFSTIPLYYSEVHRLSEDQIGYLMALNGFLIFLIEMPLVGYFEQDRFSLYRILAVSTLLFALSFAILNVSGWVGVLTIGMLLMSVGEMLNFPFLNSFAMNRAAQFNNQGDYMALFTMTFSVAHIFAHNSGMQLIHWLGYEATWYIMTGMLLLAILLLIYLRNLVKKEKAAA